MSIAQALRVNLLSYVGIGLTIAGIIISIYLYQQSKQEREPFFVSDPTRTEILNSERLAQAPIRVLKEDGTEIKSGVTAIRFYVWNAGKASIKAGNVLQQISIRLSDPDAEIIYPRILKSSRGIMNLRLDRDPSEPRKKLLLMFDIMEENDGATGQIVYVGDPQARLVVSGIIEGAEAFKTETSLRASASKARLLQGVLIFTTGFLILSSFLYRLLRALGSRGRGLLASPHIRKGRVRAIFIILYVAALAGWTYVVVIFEREDAQEVRQSIVRRVPPEVLP